MKNIIIISILLLVSSTCLMSNDEDNTIYGNVKPVKMDVSTDKIIKKGGYEPYFSKDYLYIGRLMDRSVQIGLAKMDTNENFKYFGEFDTSGNIEDWGYLNNYLIKPLFCSDSMIWYARGYYTLQYADFLDLIVVKDKGDSVEFIRKYTLDNLTLHKALHTIGAFCLDYKQEYIYYIADYWLIRKSTKDLNSPVEYVCRLAPLGKTVNDEGEEITEELPDFASDVPISKHWIVGAISQIEMKSDRFNNIWFLDRKSLNVYKPDTKELITYDIDTKDKYGNSIFEGKSQFNNSSYNETFTADYISKLSSFCLLGEKHNDAVCFFVEIYTSKGKPRVDYYSQKLYMYENNEWDTIPMPYELTTTTCDLSLISKIFRWPNEDHIAFQVSEHCQQNSLWDNNIIILIYNLNEKTWKKISLKKDASLANSIWCDATSIFRWNQNDYMCVLTTQYASEPEDLVAPIGLLKLDLPANFETSINDVWLESKVNVFPNPADKNVTITLELKHNCNVKIVLTSISGAELMNIHSGFVNEGIFSKTFSVETLPKGVYYLKISIDSEIKMEKIVVD